jgi:hypothetical protein
MPKPTILNRIPLLGLFAHQAARHMGYSEDDALLVQALAGQMQSRLQSRRSGKADKVA